MVLKNKRTEKQKRRQKRKQHSDARSRTFKAEVAALTKFPAIRYENEGGANRDFVRIIKDDISRLARTPQSPDTNRLLYALNAFKFGGFEYAVRKLREEILEDDHVCASEVQRIAEHMVHNSLGNDLFMSIDVTHLRSFLPGNAVQIWPQRTGANDVVVRFHSLTQRKTPDGTAYLSEATLTVGGLPKTVAYSRHAAERIAQRVVVSPLSYEQHWDAFRLLRDTNCFELTTLPNGQLTFSPFSDVQPRWLPPPDEDAPESRRTDKIRRWRLGYCPAAVHNDLIIAKTLLAPGMRGTPERSILIANGWDPEELDQRVERLPYAESSEDVDFELLGALDRVGAPQVKEFECDESTPVSSPQSNWIRVKYAARPRDRSSVASGSRSTVHCGIHAAQR